MEAAEILGVDVGLKRSGLARASNVARLAEPLKTVPTDELIKTITGYLDGHPVETIVVGLPRSLDGNETEQTIWIRQWVDKAKSKVDIPICWQDEALTTIKAADIRAKKADIDAVSAAIILQDFLDGSEADRKIA